MHYSGEICEETGHYWASTCGHSTHLEVEAGETFPTCPECDLWVRWVLIRNPGMNNPGNPGDHPRPTAH